MQAGPKQNSVKSYTLAACLHCLYLTQTHRILAKRCVNSTTLTIPVRFITCHSPSNYYATVQRSVDSAEAEEFCSSLG